MGPTQGTTRVISPEQGEEEQGAEEEEASVTCTDSEDSSQEQDGSPQDTTRTPLSEDSHQHGLMLAAYREVGNDYAVDNGQLTKGLEALQSFESVPRRWPLARLTVPLLKCVDYLDRVLAGCCWEVLITRKDPERAAPSSQKPDPHVGELSVGVCCRDLASLPDSARCSPD